MKAIEERTLGININDKGLANIKLWAPLLEKVALFLPGKNYTIDLKKDEWGFWRGSANNIQYGDTYKYILDGDKQRPDPASLAQPDGVHGPSQVINLKEYNWTDLSWKNIPLDQYIIYELHPGTFTEEGNFDAIKNKLNHLKELGVTAIELMPVAQFPGGRNWGYDGVFPFAVQNSYGGAKGLQDLVNTCHEHGFAVILDVVYNHIGPEGNYLGDYGLYFTAKYNTPWGKAINFDDAWCDGVREFYIENVLMWLRDFHIDALRMDAVHAIKDFSPKHILQEIRENVDLLKKQTGNEHHLIVELDLNDTRFIDPLQEKGFGMDAQWIDEFHHALRVTSGEPRTGYYADFNGLRHLSKAYLDAYVYDGLYSYHRHKTFGIKSDKNPGQQFIVFSQNHDHVGNRMLGERTSQLVSIGMLKLLLGATLVSPFIPMLFMGEEYGETNPFLYFISHTDQELVEAVRKGRKAEFADFHGAGNTPDPAAEETFNNSKLQWNLLDREPHKTLLEFYKSFISIRKENKVLNKLNRKNITVHPYDDKQILVLHRWENESHIWCILNFSKQQQSIELPFSVESFNVLLNSADLKWEPEKKNLQQKNEDTNIIQPESLIIYSN